MAFNRIKDILDISQKENKEFWKIIIEDDMSERNVTFNESFSKMTNMFDAMIDADKNYSPVLRSQSGLSGGDGAKLETFRKQENRLIVDFLTMVMEKAVKMGESNACMRRIVAAPTAGSCGVIPAVLITYYEQKKCEKEKIIKSLYVAAGIGQVIANTASISGAEGGCQAEIGSASSMAAGLVEVPCIKRNVCGAVNAVTSSQMALAGIESKIPTDEVFEAMGRIGHLIPSCLKETSQDGLATTTTALKISEKLQEKGMS